MEKSVLFQLLAVTLIHAPIAAAQTRWWTQPDVSPAEQAALQSINHARADPVGTLQQCITAAPTDPVLAAIFAAQAPATTDQLLTNLKTACATAAANASTYPRSAAISSAPFALYPLFQAKAAAASSSTVWPALAYPPGRLPPAYDPLPPLAVSQPDGPAAVFTGPDASGGTASFGPFGSNAWDLTLGDLYLPGFSGRELVLAWLCAPGSGSPAPEFLTQGDALPDLTLGHTRLAGISFCPAAADGSRTVAFVRGSSEFLTQSDLPFGAVGTVFITGAAFRDQNSNGVYDAGEGLAGIQVTVDHGGWGAVTGGAGGYAIPVAANSGSYTVTASGPGLPVTSRQVTVAGDNVMVDWAAPPVAPLLPPQTTVPAPDGNAPLINVSARGLVESGPWPLTAGFVISGPPGATKRVLIRGVGPSLQTAGVAANLCVPATVLTVYAGSQVQASNSGWAAAPDAGEAVAQAAAAVGAFPLTKWAGGGGDSALLLQLNPGLYTASVAPPPGIPGVDATGHIGLAEVYDCGGDTGCSLVNLSARGTAGSGEQAMVIGATVGGSGHQRLLIRASGPALTAFGVSPTLANPALTVFDGSGAVVAANDDWSRSPQTDQLRSVAAAVGAFALPEGGTDAAVLQLAAPGGLTAQVSPAASTTPGGITLVELYTAP